jgi:hypothetical protein
MPPSSLVNRFMSDALQETSVSADGERDPDAWHDNDDDDEDQDELWS